MQSITPPLIAVIGSDGSGKSTVCEHLITVVEKYGAAERCKDKVSRKHQVNERKEAARNREVRVNRSTRWIPADIFIDSELNGRLSRGV